MSKLQFGCELRYEVAAPTTFLFNLSVAQTGNQNIVSERLELTPAMPIQSLEVGLERNRVHRVVLLQPGSLHLRYEGVVELDGEIDSAAELPETSVRELPAQALPYLNPSRYCESDLLATFAYDEFGALPPGLSRVNAVCDWTYHHIRYTSGSTHAATTARDVLVQRRGVCRDFAHLAITLCRGLGIPARYVSGYAVDLQPPDFHGFFEAFLGERWYLFDATRLAPLGGLVRIAAGHDAADVPSATLIGSALLQSQQVWASRVDGRPLDNPEAGRQAVSTI